MLSVAVNVRHIASAGESIRQTQQPDSKLQTESVHNQTSPHCSLRGGADSCMQNYHFIDAPQCIPCLPHDSITFGGHQQPELSQHQGSLNALSWHPGLLDRDQQNIATASSLQAGKQGMAASKPSPPLQLPAHVQQWLARLARHTQQAVNTSNAARTPHDGNALHQVVGQEATEGPASRQQPNEREGSSSPGKTAASAAIQEDLKQMRLELADVKARFADAQACALSFIH